MKAVIYQYWSGNLTQGNEAGVKLMREYAEKIGVEYVFEKDPKWPQEAKIQTEDLGPRAPYYGAFKPLFDSHYDTYDYILFCDTDVIPVKTGRSFPRQNIFGEFMQARIDNPGLEVWISEEYMQPKLRTQHNVGGITSEVDKAWAKSIEGILEIKLPRTEDGLIRVFNSGVVMYSAYARKLAQKSFVDFKRYTTWCRLKGYGRFYQCDQPYLHAMLEKAFSGHWGVMPYKWNSQIHHTPGTGGQNPRPVSDYRQDDTQFVHVQLSGADQFTMEEIKRVVND